MAVSTTGAPTGAPAPDVPRRSGKRSAHRWTRRDKLVLALMIGIPTLISVALVWVPALASVALSFTRWDGIGLDSIQWVGLRNYREIFTIYPPFCPALWHNLIWLLFFLLIPTPIGLFLAVLLDKRAAVHPRLPERDLPAGRAVAGDRRLHLAADLLDRPGPDQRGHRRSSAPSRSTGSATRSSTCGRCSSPRAGGTSAT